MNAGLLVTAALSVCAYAAGSIPFGLILARRFAGEDIRKLGSGNIGAANVSRVAGRGVAAITLALDMVKGFAPVCVGRLLGLDAPELAVIGGLAVLGHDFSLFLRLRGGKGVATTLGTGLAAFTLPALVAIILWLACLGVWRYSSLASLIALFSLPVLVAAFDGPAPFIPLTLGLALLAVYTHRDNLARLSGGTERRLGSRRIA